MTAYAQQAKFVKIIRSIGKMSDRMSVITTEHYKGFCLDMVPGEVNKLKSVMQDEGVDVTVVGDRMQLVQGISDSGIGNILF